MMGKRYDNVIDLVHDTGNVALADELKKAIAGRRRLERAVRQWATECLGISVVKDDEGEWYFDENGDQLGPAYFLENRFTEIYRLMENE